MNRTMLLSSLHFVFRGPCAAFTLVWSVLSSTNPLGYITIFRPYWHASHCSKGDVSTYVVWSWEAVSAVSLWPVHRGVHIFLRRVRDVPGLTNIVWYLLVYLVVNGQFCHENPLLLSHVLDIRQYFNSYQVVEITCLEKYLNVHESTHFNCNNK
jgi:hypothetical protein